MRRSPAAARSRSASGSSSRRSRSCRPRCSWEPRCPSSRRGSATAGAAERGSAGSTRRTPIGGVLGAVVAGFYLLRLYDAHVATYVAVALNLGVAAAASALARRHATGRIDAVDAPRTPRARGVDVALCLDGVVGHDGARSRSALDSAPVVAARRDRVHVRADPCRVPVRPRARQRRGRGLRRPHRAAHRARVLPIDARRRDGRRRVCARAVAPVLADRRSATDDGGRRLAARLAARGVRRVARRAPVGRELSARARGRHSRRRGAASRSRPAVRGEHGGRHRGSARDDVRARRRHRQPARAASC